MGPELVLQTDPMLEQLDAELNDDHPIYVSSGAGHLTGSSASASVIA